jgi:hypothetical protein
MGNARHRTPARAAKAWLCGALLVGAGLSGALHGAADAATPVLPGAPRVTGVTPGIRSISVAFARPAANGSPRITGYRATCASSNGGVAGTRQGFNSPISVTGLTATKKYTCAVLALTTVSIGPLSKPSGTVVTLPTVPGVPTITSETPGFHKVTIAFKPSTDGGAPITNYRVTCGGNYGLRSHQAFKSPITIACVEGAEEYTCTVAAYNRIGWSHSSAPSAEVVSLPITPGPPQVTSVTAGVRSATVAFAQPVNDGGVRISGYRVVCTSSNGGVVGSHQGFKSPVTVAGLSAGMTYSCTVAAINLVSMGPASTPSSAVVPLS